MSVEGNRFQNHVHLARDLTIGAAVLFYFIGFVYLYSYVHKFSVPLFSIQLAAPQIVFVFAYHVTTQNPGLTIAGIIVVVILASFYDYAIERLPEKLDRKSRVRKSVLILLAIAFILIAFPLAYQWSLGVALTDVALAYKESHVGSSHCVKLTVNGVAAPATEDFRKTIAMINQAGAIGRAIPVAETADRIFILVGATPRSADDPYEHLHADRLFAINKSLIALEDTWQN